MLLICTAEQVTQLDRSSLGSSLSACRILKWLVGLHQVHQLHWNRDQLDQVDLLQRDLFSVFLDHRLGKNVLCRKGQDLDQPRVSLDDLPPDGRLPDEDEKDEEASEHVDAADHAQNDLEQEKISDDRSWASSIETVVLTFRESMRTLAS